MCTLMYKRCTYIVYSHKKYKNRKPRALLAKQLQQFVKILSDLLGKLQSKILFY